MNQRLLSLDVFRGLTVFLMILVNSQGNQAPYALLTHSEWNGCTLADLVFPWFIFIVGFSAVLSMTQKKITWHLIIKRSMVLFSLGLLLNAFPDHFNLAHLRFFGILQRIALCYLFSAYLFATTSITTQRVIVVTILLSYWFILSHFGHSIAAELDQALLGANHLYKLSYDPEGLLSTFPCLAIVLFGNLSAMRLLAQDAPEEKIRDLYITGLLALGTAWVWSYWLPLNKILMTSSTVLWTSGLALIVFTTCYLIFDIKHQAKRTKFFQLLGQNSLAVYLLHVLGLKIQALFLLPNAHGELVNVRLFLTEYLFFWTPPPIAALAYALCYCLFCYAVILKFFSARLVPVYFKAGRNNLS